MHFITKHTFCNINIDFHTLISDTYIGSEAEEKMGKKIMDLKYFDPMLFTTIDES